LRSLSLNTYGYLHIGFKNSTNIQFQFTLLKPAEGDVFDMSQVPSPIAVGDSILFELGSDHDVKTQEAPGACTYGGLVPFDSGDVGAMPQFEHIFVVPGDYHFFCTPHCGEMQASVSVVEVAGGEGGEQPPAEGEPAPAEEEIVSTTTTTRTTTRATTRATATVSPTAKPVVSNATNTTQNSAGFKMEGESGLGLMGLVSVGVSMVAGLMAFL
jgi:plastocyanin